MSDNSLGDVNELSPFRFWCQRVLPLVYDDNLSDYELLCKVVGYINNLITDEQQLVTAYENMAADVATTGKAIAAEKAAREHADTDLKADLNESVGDLKSALDTYLVADLKNLYTGHEIHYNKTVTSNGEEEDSTAYSYVIIPVTSGIEYTFAPAPRFVRLKVNGSIVDSDANVTTYTPSQSGDLICILYNTTLDNAIMCDPTNNIADTLPVSDKDLSMRVSVNGIITPQMYGAKGDGTTDDTAAFVSAIEAAKHGELYVPSGKYIIKGELSLNYPITIRGALKTAVAYKGNESNANDPVTYIIVGSNINRLFILNSAYITISDIAVDCCYDSANANQPCANYGFWSDDTDYISRLNLVRVQVRNAKKDGFHICPYLSTITNCIAYDCHEIGFSLGSSNGRRMTSTTIESCYADSCPTGYEIRAFVYSAIIGCACDNSTIAYIFRSSQISVLSCGCEKSKYPMQIYECIGMSVMNFFVANMINQDEDHSTNAVIRTFNRTQNLIISGLVTNQITTISGVEPFMGYKLILASSRRGDVTILDDSIKYAEIYVNETVKPNKYDVSFPRPRSAINDYLDLGNVTKEYVTCTKVHNGEWILSVSGLPTPAPTNVKVFGVAQCDLDAGQYIVRGTEETSENNDYGISIATSGYGEGVLVTESGEWQTFTLTERIHIYVALQMRQNAERTVRFIPEIIKVI